MGGRGGRTEQAGVLDFKHVVEGLGADGAQNAECHVDVALGARVVKVGVQRALVFVVTGPCGLKAGGCAVNFL